MEIDEMLLILDTFDSEDYDVVKKLIPFVFTESLEEYNKSFNLGDDDRGGLRYLITERIFWFLVDNTIWENGVDIDAVNDVVEEYYNK